MPNWCATELVITGSQESLDELETQMKQPYQALSLHYADKRIEERTVEGNFLLWNAIRPIDLDAYFEVEKMNSRIEEWNSPVITPKQEVADISEVIAKAMAEFDPAAIAQEFAEDVATKQDWYHWNIRNWGTKWDVGDEASVENGPNKITYTFSTAWSPCSEAVDNLAKQYPMLTFTMTAVDEGALFACEIHWNNGERAFDLDLPYTHELCERMYGVCWTCDDEQDPDDLDLEEMEAKGCLEVRKAREQAENA